MRFWLPDFRVYECFFWCEGTIKSLLVPKCELLVQKCFKSINTSFWLCFHQIIPRTVQTMLLQSFRESLLKVFRKILGGITQLSVPQGMILSRDSSDTLGPFEVDSPSQHSRTTICYYKVGYLLFVIKGSNMPARFWAIVFGSSHFPSKHRWYCCTIFVS